MSVASDIPPRGNSTYGLEEVIHGATSSAGRFQNTIKNPVPAAEITRTSFSFANRITRDANGFVAPSKRRDGDTYSSIIPRRSWILSREVSRVSRNRVHLQVIHSHSINVPSREFGRYRPGAVVYRRSRVKVIDRSLVFLYFPPLVHRGI